MSGIKRHTYLVNRNVQFKYMGLVGVPLVILLGAMYYIIYYAVFNEMLIPEAVAVTLVPAMKKVNILIAFLVPISLFLVLRAALVYSNRIVGPFPRLERELDRVLAGDHSIRFRTRDDDELSAFIQKLNLVIEKLQAEKGDF